ncbi:MAG: Lrp/AsnC family transcriptional regulator [Verrucomicrobia bacterium]|nr:Lrp/AsnC family transcriptional regulator [Verrucomicrobiota bacterium]MDA1087833.1 Lrp/AsnC family transcriptional regulator [Verrucomicrobiota bacterium]
MDALLKALKENALETPANLARMLDLSEDEVRKRIDDYEKQGVIRGYHAIVNEDQLAVSDVTAVIEVKVTPERDGGFDRIAQRISRFDEVQDLYLVSGAYDLLIFLKGDNLKDVAAFVSEKLSTLDHVTSTTTHFMLKTFKERGVLMAVADDHERLAISP